ncbi:MAG: hypothetical protein ACLQHT_08095 [Terracidiphilus sp.]
MPLPSAEMPADAIAIESSGDQSETELAGAVDASLNADPGLEVNSAGAQQAASVQTPGDPPRPVKAGVEVDAAGNPIPLERQQPKRILGFMPNFRSVSSGAKPHPLGWKYNFTVATHQATDYSSFIFLGLTSLTAEGMNMHTALGKGVGGFYAYTWRGFLDKSDNTYLSAWLLPSLLHEDTRFYALGSGHSIPIRALYVISRQAVAKTYGGRQTPNFAGLGGKVLTQVVSRLYYPPSATDFAVLASKFGYSVMRDVIFSSIREFYPDIAAHYVRKHREKMTRVAELDEGDMQQLTALPADLQ